MPIINIKLLKGRSDETLQSLAAALTEVTVQSLAAEPDRVRVILEEIDPKRWAVGGVLISDRRGGNNGS